jgi:heme exporter protein C
MPKLRIAALASAVGLAAAAYLAFVYAPEDAIQGPVQRIFYLHVPSAIAAYACFAAVLAGSILFLWRQSETADRVARAAAPVGLLFTSVTFAMGTVWAKAIWGWDPTKPWDARLTSTAVLWVIYAGYLMVRRFSPPGRTAARLAAIVGAVGFIDVPVVHFSVQWWRTIHPDQLVDATTGPALPPEMLTAFIVAMAALLLLAGTLVAARYRIEVLKERREAEMDEEALVALPGTPARASR